MNPPVSRLRVRAGVRVEEVRKDTVVYEQPTTELIAAEHERILELIEAGDEDGAAALLAIHIGRARERLAERLGGVAGPEAFVPPTV